MNTNENLKITYAQRRLIELINKRELRSWCMENNLDHSSMYRIALGQKVPTYAIVSSLVHLIPPAEWIYNIDEKIPYESKTVDKWNPENISSFVKRHKIDWASLSEKYDIPLETCRNIFVNYRAKPSMLIIKKIAEDIDPIEFFIEGDGSDGNFYPERGDIVTISGKTMLVLTKQKQNKQTHSFVGVCVNNDEVELSTLTTVTYVRTIPELIGKANEELLDKVMKMVKGLFK